MAHQPAAWRLLLRSYPCQDCGASPGDPCMTSGGQVAGVEHSARQRLVQHCPRCGTRLAAEADPGSRCARCQLLHDLNTERATTHKRTT